MGNRINREARNQWERKLIARFVMGNRIDSEIDREVRNGKQN